MYFDRSTSNAAKPAQDAIKKGSRPAMDGCHALPFARVSGSLEQVNTFSGLEGVRAVSIPSAPAARAKFFRKWARAQRRKALAGGMAATLVLPLLGAEALAQTGQMVDVQSLEGVVSMEIQADGSLLIVMENGAELIVPESQYQVAEDGTILVGDAVIAAAFDAGSQPVEDGGVMGLGDGGAIMAAVGGIAVAGLAVAAASSSSSSETPDTVGFVIDGYIAGATVFYDENGNGVLDEGEISTTTDASGSFALPGGVDAPIVAFGGFDISTGLQSTLTLSSPAGSTVVSPLTTMVQSLVAEGASVEAATSAVAAAMGLDPATDILNEDPIAEGNDALFAAGVKVAQFLTLAEAAGVPQGAAAAALANALNDPEVGENILSDAAALEALLDEAADDASIDFSGLAGTIANANAVVDQKVEDGGDVQASIATVQQAVQGTIAGNIRDAGAPPSAPVSPEEIDEIIESQPPVDEDGTVIIDLSLMEDFSDELELTDSQAEGAWYTDRTAPGEFEIDTETFAGESVLKQTIDSYAEDGPFRQTQGRKLDMPEGSTSASIDLYIDPEWDAGGEQDGFRQAGFWATTFDSDQAVSGYPIIEFATLDGEPGFRIWVGEVTEDGWMDFDWEGDIPFGEFVNLDIAVHADGSVTYTVGNQSQTVEGVVAPDSTVGNVILQTYNQTYDEEGEVQTDEARDAYSVYWDNLASDGGILPEDRDVSIYENVSFEPSLFVIPEGVTLTARMDQLDGVEIVGNGTVELTGAFDAAADLSGLIGTGVAIDASAVEGFELTLTPEQAEGLELNLASDASVNVDVTFTEPSGTDPLEPRVDVSGFTVDGEDDIAALFNILESSMGFEDAMTLLWGALDAGYDLGEYYNAELNGAFVELGNIYADYLVDGGEPLLAIVQTNVGGNPDAEARQQSLHDNLLGNLTQASIDDRYINQDLDDPRNDNASTFADRPLVSGNLENGGPGEDFIAGLLWDLANGYPREDADDLIDDETVYVIGSDGSVGEYTSIQAAVDAAGDDDTLYVTGGTFEETVRVESNVTITMTDDAVLDGGFVVTDGNTLNLTGGTIENGATDTSKIIGGIVAGGGKAVYLQGSASVIADGTTFRATEPFAGPGEPQTRAIEADASGAVGDRDGEITLTNVSFEGPWLSAVYVNAGARTVTIDGVTFTDMGTDEGDHGATTRWVVIENQSGDVSIIDSTFVSEFRSGGISVADDDGVEISGNDFSEMSGIAISASQTATFGANRIGDRDFEQVIIAGTVDDEGDEVGDSVVGGAGDDLIFSGPLGNQIDLSEGGADVIVLNADTVGRDGFTDVITGFDATEDGGDVLALFASEYALRGDELQLLSAGDELGDNTGVAVYVTDFDLESILADPENGKPLEEEVLEFFGGPGGGNDLTELDGMFIVVTNRDHSIVGRFEFDGSDVEIPGLAYLDEVDGTELTISNFDLSNVFGDDDPALAT